MSRVIITVFPDWERRVDIEILQGSWPTNMHFLLSRGFRFKRQKKTTIYLPIGLLPGNRWPLVHKANKLIHFFILRKYLERSRPKVLWIRDTDYYIVHNGLSYDFLVLDCRKDNFEDLNKEVFYRQYFRVGWKFAFYLSGIQTHTWIFKHKNDGEIIVSLRNFFDKTFTQRRVFLV